MSYFFYYFLWRKLWEVKISVGKFDLAREIKNYQQSLTAEKCARYIKNLKKVIKKIRHLNKEFKMNEYNIICNIIEIL